MSNRHYIKKKPQNKSYSPSSGCASYLSPEDNGNVNTAAMGPMYEQIKSEVVSSVLNWLSMYMAADQEDKKVNEQVVEPGHCCECTINRRNEKSNPPSTNSSFSSSYSKNRFDLKYNPLDNTVTKFSDVATYTGEDENVIISDKVSDTPEDSNMISTDFKAGQVWPDWCKYLEKAVGKHSNGDLSNSQVYYDKFNDRLCVYRRGLVEYPQLRKKSPRIENTNLLFKQNLKSIPEVRESLLRNGEHLLNDKNILSVDECLSESNRYFINPDYKHRDQTEHLSIDNHYCGLNLNEMPNSSTFGNYSSNMVKWISLPNVQFQE